MGFQPDQPRFESLTQAFTYILGQYALEANTHVWNQSKSGLVYPRERPRYLFRGECGKFDTTMDSARRLQAEVLKGEFQLPNMDVVQLGKLIAWLGARLCMRLDGLDRAGAVALLQHYGLPSRVVDLTGDLGVAFTFAATGKYSTGRVAVVPYPPCQTVRVLELFGHPWAERAQRQAAYGVVMTDQLADLKSEVARSLLNIKWYEFRIAPSDRSYLEEIYQGLVRESDDPSAGFVRFHITEYVEECGKLSPMLTDWLLDDRVLIAPYCYLVEAFEEKDAVVYYRGSEVLPAFNKDAEAEHSRRYWSSAHPDYHSGTRMKTFVWPAAGSIVADPRTYHPDL
jgi:hypothetical protein